ncbi:MAG: hypothetical protein N839_0007645 [Desulfofustis sp. PB-SRB1]|nr:hypothetical protein [Desulfofustis sp. PB-SRB1]MBM1002276.1 hypothetical protein [Desulfofustis sp. PB-SRB1]HBH29573.1 hypothetical protein [Desulfofustis sp.]
MKAIHLLLAFCAALLIFSFPVKAADLEDGFMGYRWGDDVWQHDGLQELYRKGDLVFYADPGLSYELDGAVIGDVIYGYYREKFYSVYVNISSLDTYDAVMRHLKESYGLPDIKTSTQDNFYTYKWKYQDVSIKLKTNRNDGTMKVAFYHEPTAQGLNRERIMLDIEQSDRFFPLKKGEDVDMRPFLESWELR